MPSSFTTDRLCASESHRTACIASTGIHNGTELTFDHWLILCARKQGESRLDDLPLKVCGEFVGDPCEVLGGGVADNRVLKVRVISRDCWQIRGRTLSPSPLMRSPISSSTPSGSSSSAWHVSLPTSCHDSTYHRACRSLPSTTSPSL
jgi:hypothetical protein